MQRSLNGKLLFWTLAVSVFIGTGVHFAHGLQVRRNAWCLLEFADRYHAAGKRDQAIAFYMHYLACEPDDTGALAKLGQALDEQTDAPRSVVSVYEELIKRDPSRRDVRYRLVLNLIQLQRLRESIAQIQILLPHWENKAELEHMLGWCQEAQGEYPKAAAAFARALALDPRREESYVLLAGVLHDRLGQREEGIKIMDELVSANPQSFRVYLIRARFCRQRNHVGGVDTDLKRALELAPREPAALLAAADWAQVNGNLTQAQEWMHKAWDLEPRNPDVIKALVELANRAGRPADAIAVLTAAARALPDDPELRGMLADLREDDTKLGEAAAALEAAATPRQLDHVRARLEQLANRQKSWARIPILLGQIEELAGNQGKAASHYIQAVRLGDREPRHIVRLVQTLVRFQRFLDAEQILHKVEVEAAPVPELQRLGAEIALANQNAPVALGRAAQAVAPGSDDYRDFVWLGRIYHGAGADPKAEEALRRSIALAPHTPDPWIALAEQLGRTGQQEAARTLVVEAKANVSPALALDTEARCLEAIGLVTEAEARYRQGLKPMGAADQDTDFILLAHAADFFMRTDEAPNAEPFLAALCALDGNAPPEYLARARRQLALVLAGKGSEYFSQALALIDANLQIHPNNPVDTRARGAVEAFQPEHLRRSIRIFEETARRFPLSVDEQFQLTKLFDAIGDQARSREHIVALLVRQPENAQYLAFYIRSLLRSGEIDQARALIRKLERLEPDSRRTRELNQMTRSPKGPRERDLTP